MRPASCPRDREGQGGNLDIVCISRYLLIWSYTDVVEINEVCNLEVAGVMLWRRCAVDIVGNAEPSKRKERARRVFALEMTERKT